MSKRRKAKASGHDPQCQHERILEGALDHLIFSTDADGRIDYWSAGAESILGWKPHEIIGQDIGATFTPEDRAAGVPDEERILARTEGCAPDVRWHQRKDGSRVFIDGTTRALRDEQGRLTGYVKIGQDVTERRLAQDELRDSEAGLRDLTETLERRVAERTAALADSNRALLDEIRERESAEDSRRLLIRMLVAAEEKERGRLSRELHDHVGQQLTGLLLGLRVLERDEPSPERLARIRELGELTSTLSGELHEVAVQLRPPALDNLGLERALRSHLDEWSERHGIEVEFEADPLDETSLTGEIEATIYRIVQEALTNVVKHANATRVEVELERREGSIVACVTDNGVGFDPSNEPRGGSRRLGLRGMRERLALLGGRLEISSGKGEGTTLTAHIPVVEKASIAAAQSQGEGR